MGDSNVCVAVRCRPFNKRELELKSPGCVVIKDDKNICLETPDGPKTFGYDYVYGESAEQGKVFEDIGVPILEKAFGGYNGTIFAYGQTGSGKTWSMTGGDTPELEGIIPRLNKRLFDRIKEDTAKGAVQYMVEASYFEIYNEIIYDLLDPTRKAGEKNTKDSLQIKESKALGIYVQGLQQVLVESMDQVQALMDQGNKMRTAAATSMNARSSRSHSIFILKIQQKDVNNPNRVIFAAINLVDLAGSERASKTEATGARLKEGSNINKSLMSLGNVISSLAENANGKKKFIPYRDSKLTRVLQNSLGGNSLCSMLATCSPALDNIDETMSTLKYANRAKMIKVKASKNEEMTKIDALKDEVGALKRQLAELAVSASGGGGGLGDEEKMKLKAEYEAQMEELKKNMITNWDNKAELSKKHEKERQLLLAKNREEQKQLQRQFELEKQKRWDLLEEKGDIEGLLRELQRRVQKAGEEHTGGLTMAELDVWCSMIVEAKKAEVSAKEQKTVLLVYKNAFEADLNALHGPGPSVPGASPGGSPPPSRVKAIIDQAQAKLLTLGSETETWENLSENTLATAKRVSTAMATKLGPPPRSPVKGEGGNAAPPSPSASYVEPPFGAIDEEVQVTKEALKGIVPGPKPPLSTKLLTRPPFRYLQDLINAVTQSTGFGHGLFEGLKAEGDSKTTTREYKIEYVNRLMDCIGLGLGRSLHFCSASMVVAGSECEKTNRMLQNLSQVATDDSLNFDDLVKRVLSGEKPQTKAPLSTNQDDDGESGTGLRKEYAGVIQRALNMIRKIWLSSESLLRIEDEKQKMHHFGQSVGHLSNVLKAESSYWEEADSELSASLRASATNVAPQGPHPPGEAPSDTAELYKHMLGAFNVLQSSLSLRIKRESDASKESLASSEARLLELESAFQSLTRDAQSKDDQIKELETALATAAEEKNRAVEAEQEWREKGETAEREKGTIEKECDKFRNLVSKKDIQVEELKTSFSDAETKLKEGGREISSLREQVTELESMTASLKSQLQTSGDDQQAMERMQSDLAATRGKLVAANLEAERHEEELQKLESQRDRYESDLGKSAVALSTANSLCQEWEQKALGWEQNHKRLMDEHQAFKAEHEKTLESIEAMKSKVEESAQARAAADAARAKAMGEVLTLKSQINEMEHASSNKVVEQEASLELQTQVLSLTAKNELLAGRCNKLEEELKVSAQGAGKLLKLSGEMEKLKQDMADMEEEHDEAISVLTEERDGARLKEEEYYHTLQMKLQDLEDTQAGYVDLSDRLNDRVDQIFDLEEKSAGYKQQVEDLLAEKMKLQTELLLARKNGGGEGEVPSSAAASGADTTLLNETVENLKSELLSAEKRANIAEEAVQEKSKIEKSLQEKASSMEKIIEDKNASYAELAKRLDEAETAAMSHMDTLAEHMKRSDEAIESLEAKLAKVVTESERWENRAVEAESELMEIEERKLDEKMKQEELKERRAKKAEFSGIDEISEDPEVAVSGSGVSAVRHLAYSSRQKTGDSIAEEDDDYGDDDFDHDDDGGDEEYGDDFDA